jgi:hypothetical protein
LAGVVTISASSPLASSAARTRACRAARTSDPGNPSITFVGKDSQPGFELGDHRIDHWRRRLRHDSRLELDLGRPCSPTLLDIRQLARCRQVVRCGLEDVFELADRFVIPAHFEQGTPKRDASGQICRVLRQAVPADANGVLELTCTPMLFRKLRKRNRRRILLDPASKFFNPRIHHAGDYGTAIAIGLVTVVDIPLLSVTVNETLNVRSRV